VGRTRFFRVKSMTRRRLLAFVALSSLWAGTTLAQVSGAPTLVPAVAPPVLPMAQAQDTLSARTLVRLDQLSRQLSEATGRIEALEAVTAAQKAENERLAGLLDATRAAQAAPPSAPAPAPVVEAKAMTIDQAAALMATPPSAEMGMFVAPTPPPIAPAIMLTNARTALQSGNYLVAEANLTQLIWVYPASPEASEGRWLLGEARYVQSAWGTAAQAYVDYLKASPQGPRATEALLRLAGSFRQLGDNRQRCVALAEFKRRAPRPDPTLKARADGEIARMTCPTT
jgi:TolA-binding protein